MESEKFKKLLIKRKTSQRKLADKIGMAPSALCNKVNGKVDFRLKEVITLCELLSIDDPKEYFW